jgi:uncharacterized heparinase superfamily protein
MSSDRPQPPQTVASRQPTLTLADRSLVTRLRVERARKVAAARVLGSPLLRWRFGAPVADELSIVPQDLRAADPSFASELEFGHFGLAGAVAVLGAASPFELTPPSEDWSRELHGFGWLRHLRSARSAKARDFALGYVDAWITTRQHRNRIAREPAVMGRRLISWLTNAGLLLEGVTPRAYARTTDSLGDQMIQLAAHWRHAPEGLPRLNALSGLVLAELCVAGHDKHLAESELLLAGELDRQILPDGGHVSRNPDTLIELLLDILPLRQCFIARQRKVPRLVDEAVARVMPMLRYMRLGDGALARFNGVGANEVEAVVTVLSYDPAPDQQLKAAPHSGYSRLVRGATVIIADVAGPPPLPLAGRAHAGALSFEISSGTSLLFVNGGAPGPADANWRPASRATASHNSLAIEGRSSSRLLRNPRLEGLLQSAPIRGPETVTADLETEGDAAILTAEHDGFVERFGLLHQRRLKLSADGLSLDGVDRLGPRAGDLARPTDRLYAIHFHVHPDVRCELASGRASATLTTVGGERWIFSAEGSAISLEESVYFADISGPRDSLQLVLRGSVSGPKEIAWRLARTDAAPRA